MPWHINRFCVEVEKKIPFSSLQNIVNCQAECPLKTDINVEKFNECLIDFLVLISKLGNRKLNSTGICNEGTGLVGVHKDNIYITNIFFKKNIYFSGMEETAATEIAQPEVGIKITHGMTGRNGPPLSSVGVGQTVQLHIWVDQGSVTTRVVVLIYGDL